MKNVRSSQPGISMNFCSKAQVLRVSIIKNQPTIYDRAFLQNEGMPTNIFINRLPRPCRQCFEYGSPSYELWKYIVLPCRKTNPERKLHGQLEVGKVHWENGESKWRARLIWNWDETLKSIRKWDLKSSKREKKCSKLLQSNKTMSHLCAVYVNSLVVVSTRRSHIPAF